MSDGNTIYLTSIKCAQAVACAAFNDDGMIPDTLDTDIKRCAQKLKQAKETAKTDLGLCSIDVLFRDVTRIGGEGNDGNR